MSDEDNAVFARAAAALRAEAKLLGHDGARRFHELEDRMGLAHALMEMGIAPSRSDRRNISLYKAALMKKYSVRKWRDAIDAHAAPRPGDREWSGPAREAKVVQLASRLSDKPWWARGIASPPLDRLQAARERPRDSEVGASVGAGAGAVQRADPSGERGRQLRAGHHDADRHADRRGEASQERPPAERKADLVMHFSAGVLTVAGWRK